MPRSLASSLAPLRSPEAAGSSLPTGAPAWRCLLVWALATVVLAAGTLLGLEGAASMRPGAADRAFDLVLVDLAGALAALVCPWLWALTSLGVADALRGKVSARAGWWHRLTLVACGCAATVALGSTAQAATALTDTPGGSSDSGAVELLQGLPYPDRPAVGPDHGDLPAGSTSTRPTSQVGAPRLPAPRESAAADALTTAAAPGDGATHVVRSGDTLWAIARTQLDSGTRAHGTPVARAPDSAVARAVAALHQANRDLVGPDPDAILPGQQLALDLSDPHHPDPSHREDAR